MARPQSLTRSRVAQTPSARLKVQRALDHMLVRGVKNVTAPVLLGAIISNLVHLAQALVARPMPHLWTTDPDVA